MLDQLRRRIAKTLRHKPAGRTDGVSRVRGHIERLEDRTVLSASLAALPSWIDGVAVPSPGVAPPHAEFVDVEWLSARDLGEAGTPLRATAPDQQDAPDWHGLADDGCEDVRDATQPTASAPLFLQQLSDQPATTQSLASEPGSDGLYVVRSFFPRSPDGGGATAETTSRRDSSPAGPLAATDPNGAENIGTPTLPVDSNGTADAFIGHRLSPADRALWSSADVVWYSMMTSSARQSGGSAASSETDEVPLASLSAYDAAFETYSLEPISLVWDIESGDASTSYSSSDKLDDADGDSDGGFVELDAADLGDDVLPGDVIESERDAVRDVLAALHDVSTPQDKTATAEHDDAPPATEASHPAPAPASDGTGDLAAVASEGGMVLLQPGSGDGPDDYGSPQQLANGNLAAVYLVSPDKLLDKNVEMDASVGMYQAFDVAAGDARSVDGKPVKLAEPVRATRPPLSTDGGSTPDAA